MQGAGYDLDVKTNAARELLAMVDRWNRGQKVWEVRDSGDGIWLEEHRAVRLLREVEGYIASQDDPEEFADLVDELRRFVFASDTNWGTNASRLEKHDRTQLRLVADLMDSSPAAAVVDEVEIDALRDTVQQCLDVLDTEVGDVEERANYVRYLLRRCLDILEGEEVDLLALRDLSFQATGAVTAVSLNLPDEARKKIGQVFIRLIVPWVSNVTSGVTSGVITASTTVGLLPPGS